MKRAIMIILTILSLALILGCQAPESSVSQDDSASTNDVVTTDGVPSTEEVEISDSLDDLDELNQLEQDLDADLGLEELDTFILE